MAHITNCKIDPNRLLPLKECMETYDMASPEQEFRWNCISTFAIAYSCGALARKGDRVEHHHDPAELELCRTLAKDAAKLVEGMEVVWIEALEENVKFKWWSEVITDCGLDIEQVKAERLDFSPGSPELTDQASAKLSQSFDIDEGVIALLNRWKRMMHWFNSQQQIHNPQFVCIGEDPLDEMFCDGGNGGCVFPRLVIGLTNAGSIVGICGCVVHA